jgi:hypothetical protein
MGRVNVLGQEIDIPYEKAIPFLEKYYLWFIGGFLVVFFMIFKAMMGLR